MSEVTRKYLNLDSTDTIFFERELEKIKARSYDIKYPALKAREVFPISAEASDGDETIVYQQYDQRGMAKFISAYGEDLPRAEVSGREFIARIKEYGASFAYNDKEIRQARRAGKPLTERKMQSCIRAMEEKLNKTAFNGDENHGIKGLFNNPNIPRTLAAKTFSASTADEILATLNSAVNTMVETTNGIEIPNMLLLPITQLNYIASTKLTTTDSRSILDVFVQNNPYISDRSMVQALNECKGAGTAGSDVMVVYRKDPEALTLEIPMERTFKPVQERNLEYVTNCLASTAGVIVYYPLSVNIVEGI